MTEIVAKTDGNPLFVEELTKTVLEAGITDQGRQPLSAFLARCPPSPSRPPCGTR